MRTVVDVQLRRSARDWAVDLGFVVAAAGLGLIFVAAVRSDPNAGEVPPLGYELAWAVTAGVILLLFRRSHPVAVALAMVVAEALSSSGIGMAAMAAFSVAILRPWRVTAAIVATNILVIGGLWRVIEGDSRGFWEGVTAIVLLHTTLAATGMLIRSQRQLVQSLQERARQAEEGQRLRIEEARHLEREQLAREMHDVLAHRISLLAVHAGALEYRGTLPPEETHAAGVIRQCAHDALEDLREVIGMLRGNRSGADEERPLPTLTDLPTLIEQSRQAGAHVTFDNRIDDLPGVPARIGRHAYRVVQEGLTNARKHAPGTHVRVVLEAPAEQGLTIEVANPLPLTGRAPLVPGAGAGLIGLRERVALVGGRLEHGETPKGDFQLRASLPWPE